MSITWDDLGARVYETGLDRGVLYLPDGSAVPWNGLTSVIESFDRASSPVYYDGMKINELVVLGDFAATMKAITYPEEFLDVEGTTSTRRGVYLADQAPQTFGLCYRTKVGTDLDSDAGYKLHIVYNLIAIPSDKEYSTMSSDPKFTEFEWKITAIPEEVPGFRPSAHIIIDSREIDPFLLTELEDSLYGSIITPATLIPMADLVASFTSWFRIRIIDNGDGTWSAVSSRDELIQYISDDPDLVTIAGATITVIDSDSFIISDSYGEDEPIAAFSWVDNGDGTWTLTTTADGFITIDGSDMFTITGTNAVYITPEVWRASNSS